MFRIVIVLIFMRKTIILVIQWFVFNSHRCCSIYKETERIERKEVSCSSHFCASVRAWRMAMLWVEASITVVEQMRVAAAVVGRVEGDADAKVAMC